MATNDGWHLLKINYLRNFSYDGGELEIIRQLEDGPNYSRYIVAYMSDSLKIQAYLTVPLGVSPLNGWPTIIFNRGHVDPEAYATDRQYLRYIDPLASAGFMVFKSDYRGIGQSEGERASLITPDNAIDVLNGIKALENSQFKVGNLGIWGHSMGAMVSLQVMLVRPDIKAGALWCGFFIPFEQAVERWSKRDRMHQQAVKMLEIYGQPQDDPQLWHDISPVNFLAEIGGPIQLHHGKQDAVIPYQDSVELNQKLEAVGKAGGLFLYADGDHNLSQQVPEAMEKTKEFFEMNLKL